jgi:predicted RNA binding protein YcfA (HicA-like mRNA interferase family)
MKRRDLIKKLESNGWYFLRAGGNHDIYTNGKRTEPIGRHTEIDEILAKKILRRNGIKQP